MRPQPIEPPPPHATNPTTKPQHPDPTLTLAPFNPLPTPPINTPLPPIRQLFPVFPPTRTAPPKSCIPDISELFSLLIPKHSPAEPLSDSPEDKDLIMTICAHCRSIAPTVACPTCRLTHYCSLTTCHMLDRQHTVLCEEYTKISETLYTQPYNFPLRVELVRLFEALYKQEHTNHLQQLAIWHRNEIIRLSQTDPLHVRFELPFNFLRCGDGDSALSFIKYWAMKTCGRVDNDRYKHANPGARTFPLFANRYEDALEYDFPTGTVPLLHLVALCLIKVRIIASINAKLNDERYQTLWETNFGKHLSAVAGERLEDFFVRNGYGRRVGEAQIEMLMKYLEITRNRNPVMEFAIREPRTLFTDGPTTGFEDTFKEATEIWDYVGDLFEQIPGYPQCVFKPFRAE